MAEVVTELGELVGLQPEEARKVLDGNVRATHWIVLLDEKGEPYVSFPHLGHRNMFRVEGQIGQALRALMGAYFQIQIIERADVGGVH